MNAGPGLFFAALGLISLAIQRVRPDPGFPEPSLHKPPRLMLALLGGTDERLGLGRLVRAGISLDFVVLGVGVAVGGNDPRIDAPANLAVVCAFITLVPLAIGAIVVAVIHDRHRRNK